MPIFFVSKKELCNFVKSKVEKNNIESVYYALSLAALLQNCAVCIIWKYT